MLRPIFLPVAAPNAGRAAVSRVMGFVMIMMPVLLRYRLCQGVGHAAVRHQSESVQHSAAWIHHTWPPDRDNARARARYALRVFFSAPPYTNHTPTSWALALCPVTDAPTRVWRIRLPNSSASVNLPTSRQRGAVWFDHGDWSQADHAKRPPRRGGRERAQDYPPRRLCRRQVEARRALLGEQNTNTRTHSQ